MFLRNLYNQFQMHNPIREAFWEQGGEDPGWGQLGRLQGLERYQSQMQSRTYAHELICAAAVKDIANRTKNKELVNCANSAIEALLDEYCGTPTRRKWPFPGPPPQVLQTVSELSLLANILQPGGLRTELEDIATKLLTRTNEMGGKAPG